MKINRKDFLGALAATASVAQHRTTLPVLSHVLIQANDNVFSARATNLDEFVEASCPCQGDLEAYCVSPSALIAVAQFGPEEVVLSMTERRVGVNNVAELAAIPAEEFPKWPSDKLKDLGVNSNDLGECIEAVSWAADPSGNTSVMRESVLVDLHTKNNAIITCAIDGRRMAYVSKAGVVPNAKFLVRAKDTDVLCKVMKGENATVKMNDNWIVAEADNIKCAVKLVEEKGFFPIHEIISSQSAMIGEVEVEPMLKALQAIKAVANGEPYIEGSMWPTKAGIKIDHATSKNQFHAVVGASIMDYPNRVKFDALLLHDLFKHASAPKVTMRLTDVNMRLDCGDLTMFLALIKGQ